MLFIHPHINFERLLFLKPHLVLPKCSLACRVRDAESELGWEVDCHLNTFINSVPPSALQISQHYTTRTMRVGSHAPPKKIAVSYALPKQMIGLRVHCAYHVWTKFSFLKVF
jgi:hypothetical protein